MYRKLICTFTFVGFLFYAAITLAAGIPQPARIGGTINVNGTQLTQTTDTGYTFVVTKQDATVFSPSAQDNDGLNSSDFYLIDIPIYDATDQPGGANPGDTAVINVYKDGVKVSLTSPSNGEFTIGTSGSTTQIDIALNAPGDGVQAPLILLLE